MLGAHTAQGHRYTRHLRTHSLASFCWMLQGTLSSGLHMRACIRYKDVHSEERGQRGFYTRQEATRTHANARAVRYRLGGLLESGDWPRAPDLPGSLLVISQMSSCAHVLVHACTGWAPDALLP